MQKKLLAASLLMLLGAGCSSTASIDTGVDTTENTGTADAATDTSADTEADDGSTASAITVDITTGADVNLDVEVIANPVVFTVVGNNFAFAPSTMTVKKGDTVTIVFQNSDGYHDFVIDEFSSAKTSRLQGGAEESITFVADTAGSFEYYCSVGEHRAMGMKGTLVVTE